MRQPSSRRVGRPATVVLARLQRGKTVILHLAEGVDDGERRHFRALQTRR